MDELKREESLTSDSSLISGEMNQTQPCECVVLSTSRFILCHRPTVVKGKGKVLPYSLLSIGPGADPGMQAVSRPPGARLPLLSARPAVTFPAKDRRHPSASTELVTEALGCEQLAQGCYLTARQPGLELLSYQSSALATRL